MRLSSGFDEVDGVNVDTFLVIAICWLAGFLAVSKGIRSYAKVATFTACASYVLMFMLFLASVVQRGSLRGLNAYFRMEWGKLGELKTWRSATQQLLYSSGLGIGLVVCYGSYKHFAWPVSPTIVKLIISDFLFSLLSGCVALSLSGHATTLYGMDLEDIVVSGYEYAFVAYPESVKHFGHAELWCIAFYLLLCILAFSSVLSYLVTAMSAFEDMYPSLRECRMLFSFATCAVLFCCSLPTVTGGGLYLLNLIDATIYLDLLPWIALAEVILIVQGYGTARLRQDIRFMTEQFPSAYFTICWSYICPLALMIVSLGTVTSKRTELFHYTYPEWSGMLTLAIILSCIFAVTTQILRILSENNNDIYAALEPEEDYGPADAETRMRYQDEMAAQNMLVPSNSSRSRKSMALTSTSANPSTALGASGME
ncbi:sodium- and chloride-dependent creatine transporter 1-like [Dermacentor silvarum]|uniref:sodium- and chloride-dependent creatine transporter 1-like n=1 Tax=Dermacentor silvarum TaxID=543639 RepID=UPI002100D08A|nr:sodium- and chloride-dependent creatine transporter 1-like [Dermacentor silvarum]